MGKKSKKNIKKKTKKKSNSVQPLTTLLILDKEVNQTMKVFKENDKLKKLRMIKVEPWKEDNKYLELTCAISKERKLDWCYNSDFIENQTIIVNKTSINYISKQLEKFVSEKDLVKKYLECNGESSDVVIAYWDTK